MEIISKDVLNVAKRKQDSHKGENGRVLVVAGSEDYAGAAVLATNACEAILRSGADNCVACCPEKIAWLVNNQLPDAITKKFKGNYFEVEHVDEIIKLSKDFDVLLIGPGLGKKSLGFAKKIVEEVKIPKVIDADAIHATDLRKVENSVITAHKKEFEKLLENSGSDLSSAIGDNVLLLKGEEDRIISKNKEAVNKTGNAVMTKGGTGDVLAGLCAGFIAQSNGLFKSACMAAYLNGAVGDILKEEKGVTFIASDIVKNMYKVLE